MLKVELTNNEQGTFLNLPSIQDEILPTVTVVTPTYNRHENFEIAIRNYKNFNYPRDKLFWIILSTPSLFVIKLSRLLLPNNVLINASAVDANTF